jgi:general secretion pathway protein J
MHDKNIRRGDAPTASSARTKIRQRGLTLIELLVAISVLAFVAVLGWRGLDGIVRARVALTSDLEQTRGMQLAFAQLQNDCAHLATISQIPDRAPLVIDQDRLTLVRTVHADGQPTRLEVITYRVRDGVLTRRESAATRNLNELDNLWLTAANDNDATQPVVLQSGVASMTMRLWENGAWRAANANSSQGTAAGASGSSISDSRASRRPVVTSTGAITTTSAPVLTGLEVALQLQGRESNMLKVFLLGAV